MPVRSLFWLVVATPLSIAACGGSAEPPPEAPTEAAVEPPDPERAEREAAAAVAQAGYVYGYPLVLMDATREALVGEPGAGALRAPVNRFARSTTFPDASFRQVVRPNVDTLYASAFLDLSAGPVTLSVPASRGRYLIVQLLDAWTNVFSSLGTRTTGDRAGKFAIVGPGFEGALPPGTTRIDSPTPMVWAIARVHVKGPSDLRAARTVLSKLTLAGPDLPDDATTTSDVAPAQAVASMDAETFFTRLATLLGTQPPAVADARIVARLATIEVVPGEPFDADALTPGQRAGLEQGVAAAREAIAAHAASHGIVRNGWRILPANTGSFGTAYLDRAAIAFFGLGANLPADAVYPTTFVDGDGRPLDGATARYTVTFDADALPPVDAFWSLTAYDEESFLVDNPIDRHRLGSVDRLRKGPDGETTIALQADRPDDRNANWLPVPAGPFSLTLRLYAPKTDALDGTWGPPPVVRLEADE